VFNRLKCSTGQESCRCLCVFRAPLQFKELNLKFIASFQSTDLLAESQQMVEDASNMVYQQVAKQEEDEIRFDLNQLKKITQL
jgi:hypothetical protein